MADDVPGRADVEAQEVYAPRRPVDAVPSRRHSARNAEAVHCIIITTIITAAATASGREKNQIMGRKERKSGGGSGSVARGGNIGT